MRTHFFFVYLCRFFNVILPDKRLVAMRLNANSESHICFMHVIYIIWFVFIFVWWASATLLGHFSVWIKNLRNICANAFSRRTFLCRWFPHVCYACHANTRGIQFIIDKDSTRWISCGKNHRNVWCSIGKPKSPKRRPHLLMCARMLLAKTSKG